MTGLFDKPISAGCAAFFNSAHTQHLTVTPLRRTIASAARRELFWLIPRDRAVTITVRGGAVGIDLAEEEVSP